MTTLGSLVPKVRNQLQGAVHDRMNVLATGVDAVVNTLVLEDELSIIDPGVVIEIGYEQMYVRDLDRDNKVVTVIRGYGTSTAASHSQASIVRIAPSYYAQDILDLLFEEVRGLRGHGLFRYETVEVEVGFEHAYDIVPISPTSTPLFVQEAFQQTVEGHWRPASVALVGSLPVSTFPSTYGLKMISDHLGGRTVRVTLAEQLGDPQSADDTLAGLGLRVGSEQVISYGAAWRIAPQKEGQRTNPDRSHGSRRAEETPPNSAAFFGRVYQSMRDDFIRNAIEDQLREYPPRRG